MFSLRLLASRAAAPARLSTRALATSARSLGDHGPKPPTLVGEGAKPGEVPTDLNQATGLERFQIMGNLQGVDVFSMEPLEMTKQGTKADPIVVPSMSRVRQIGCTGFPADSHDTIWLNASADREFNRCPECGNVYKLDFQGAEHAHHH